MFYLLSISFDLYVYREKSDSVMANILTKHGETNVQENYYVNFELNPSRKDNMAVGLVGWFMVFNTTFNNISVISWRSVLLVEETRVPRENHRPVASRRQTSSHNVVLPEQDSNSQRYW